MTAQELLGTLQDRGIRLWRQGSRLRYNAPKGALSDHLRGEIATRRAEILDLLSDSPAGEATALSFAQTHFWFHEQAISRAPAYNIGGAVQIEGHIQDKALRDSFAVVIKRHAILRTSFYSDNGEPRARIADSAIAELEVLDLRSLPENHRQTQAKRLVQDSIDKPFDLAAPPLMRSMLIRVGERESILSVTLHHIIADGWSVALLIGELSYAYTALTEGRPMVLPNLPCQYSDFVNWQKEHLRSSASTTSRGFWQEYLRGAPPALELPTDHPRPAVENIAGQEISRFLPQDLIVELRDLAKSEHLTLFMLFLAGLYTLLLRYTGQRDFVVGTAVSGRERPDFEHLIGLFINVLPLRCALTARGTVRQLLHRVRAQTLAAFEHQGLPFERIVDAVNPPRDPSRSPIFQIMFNFLNQPKANLEFPGCKVEAWEMKSQTSKMDLTLAVEQTEETFSVAAEFRTSLFCEERVRRLLNHYVSILHAFVADPDQSLHAVNPLSEEEEHELIVGWNSTGRELPCRESLFHAFEAQAAKTPDAPAFCCQGRRLSYKELDVLSGRLARYLSSRGVGVESIVSVLLERSLHFPVAVLAILKAGAAFLPLLPELPKNRLRYILEDSGAQWILTTEKHRQLLPPFRASIIEIDDLESLAIAPPSTPITVQSSNLAYVIYTSGSTGEPRGVQVPHGAAVNLLRSMSRQPDLSPEDVLLAAAPFTFDMCIPDLFLPISVGAAAVILDRTQAFDGQQLNQIIAAEKATAMQATPTGWRLLLASDWRCPHGFRVFCGGEPLPSDLATRLLADGAQIVNFYGPTETTVWSLLHPVSSNEDPVAIGKPIDNTQVYILDSHLNPVPPGVSGELYIGGAGLARGYRNQPDRTGERFVPCPFAGPPGERLYRTGDLARYRFDGNIEFLGRVDYQVKIRGHRIELNEIESVLKKHTNVMDAAAAVLPDSLGEPQLIAYWVPKSQQLRPTSNALHQHLADHLPSYMLPPVLMELSSLPLNASGKVDRKALPKPERRLTGNAETSAPRNALEAAMAELWSDVLKAPIGVMDSFFDHGGHSLLAVHLLSKIEKRFGKTIPLFAFLQKPTIEAACRNLGKDILPYSPVVRLTSARELPPFFFVPGASGNPFAYMAVVRHLESEITFYGFQPPAEAGSITSIPGLAEQYRTAMRAQQKNGPYRLGGHSFGAAVAFEIARQLRAEGEPVALLALFDLPAANNLKARSEIEWIADIAEAVCRFTGKANPFDRATITQAAPEHCKESFLTYLIESGIVPASSDLSLVDLVLDRYRASQHALAEYKLAPIDCPITAIRSQERDAGAEAQSFLGYAGLTSGQVTELSTPGDHITMLIEPNAASLAAELRKCFVATPTAKQT
jgi:amino acid adenylation domain-containing protein